MPRSTDNHHQSHEHHDHDHGDHDHDHESEAGHAHAGHSHAGHGHAGHGHAGHNHAAHATRARLGWAAAITMLFMLVEIAGGLVSGSLALLADAGHMFTDAGALALAWFAAGIAQRPADWKRSYGFDRFSVVVAFANGLALFVIAALIVSEAVQRLFEPAEVMGVPMLFVAAAGLMVNIIAFFILHGAERNLNVRGAMLHVLGDLLGSVAAIVAAIVIIYTGWTPIDPILSVLVAVLILRSAWSLVRDAGHILLEAAPAGLDSRTIAADLTTHVAGVADVHHIHIWSITEERRMATLHARLVEGIEAEPAVSAIKSRLHDQFGIAHATVEVEFGPCADPACGKVA